MINLPDNPPTDEERAAAGVEFDVLNDERGALISKLLSPGGLAKDEVAHYLHVTNECERLMNILFYENVRSMLESLGMVGKKLDALGATIAEAEKLLADTD